MLTRKMKDSGIEWIGEIPENWNSIQMKYLVNITTGNKDTVDAEPNGIYPFFIRSETPKKINTYSFDGEGILTAGDGNVGEIFHYIKGKFDFHQRVYLIYDFKNINIKYLYLYLQVNLKKHISYFSAKTTVESLRLPWLKCFPVIYPSIEEQDKIIDFLHPRISKIEKLINETQQSIEELKKYKQSLITEAVTKGLDPNVEMKDSGIEWIGKTPINWMVIKLNQLFSIKKNIANKTGYDVLSVTQRGLRVRDITKNEGQMAADYSKYQIVEKDDFVMNHMDLLTGWVDIAKQQGVTSPDYRVFFNKQKERVVNEFFLYIFQTAYTNKIFYGLGQGVSNVGRWRLQTDKFLNFYVPLPSIEEQRQIVSYLDEQTSRIDKLIEDKTKVIEELEDYKKSLIYEYVTGKKEV